MKHHQLLVALVVSACVSESQSTNVLVWNPAFFQPPYFHLPSDGKYLEVQCGTPDGLYNLHLTQFNATTGRSEPRHLQVLVGYMPTPAFQRMVVIRLNVTKEQITAQHRRLLRETLSAIGGNEQMSLHSATNVENGVDVVYYTGSPEAWMSCYQNSVSVMTMFHAKQIESWIGIKLLPFQGIRPDVKLCPVEKEFDRTITEDIMLSSAGRVRVPSFEAREVAAIHVTVSCTRKGLTTVWVFLSVSVGVLVALVVAMVCTCLH